MAITEDFAGLRMEELIGAPLRAAADAGIQMAHSMASFVENVGFEDSGKIRTIKVGYQRHSLNGDGTGSLDDMKVDIPLLALAAVPNLQVDEVNVLFDMEVKQSVRAEADLELGLERNAAAGMRVAKVSITGSVSAHKGNTRSSDNSAKYHVDVRAVNHGMPEGLARVLDIMAVSLAPVLTGRTLRNDDGQELSETEADRAEKLLTLRQEIKRREQRLEVIREGVQKSAQYSRENENEYLQKLKEKIEMMEKTLAEKWAEYSMLAAESGGEISGALPEKEEKKEKSGKRDKNVRRETD